MNPIAKKCATYIAACNEELIAQLNNDSIPTTESELVSPAFQLSLQYFSHSRWSIVINFGTTYDRLSGSQLTYQNCLDEIDKFLTTYLQCYANTLKAFGYTVNPPETH